MGTRADFYVGRGQNAEWLGSIAWDGHPDGISNAVLESKSEAAYRKAVESFFTTDDRDDVTRPADGWPWPWEDSRTTDYAYAFDDGQVWASSYGSAWFRADGEEPEESSEGSKVDFPDMSSRRAVARAGSPRSGILGLKLKK